MNLTKTNWPLGWCPSADANNGDPNGLLNMENLQLEEDGSIGLVRGFKQLVGGFQDFVSDISSKVINGTEVFWVGLNNGVQVYRYPDINFVGSTTVLSGGGTRPVFGDGLGQVIVASGQQKKKDDGTTIHDLGIQDPQFAPNVTAVQQEQVDLQIKGGGSWALIEGGSINNPAGVPPANAFLIPLPPSSFKVWVDIVTLRAVAEIIFDNPVDTTDMGSGPSSDPSSDTFYFLVQPGDTANFTKFRVELYLDLTGDNYYWMEWSLAGSAAYNLGIDTQSVLSAKRSDFTRQGQDATLDWGGMNTGGLHGVVKARIIGEAIGYDKFVAGEMRFVGGSQGQLNGYYEWLQVNVNDNGIYIAKSSVSPISEAQLVINGSVQVFLSPTNDSQVTKSWLFRKSVPAPQFTELANFNGQTINVPIPVVLDQFYKVGEGLPGSTITDNLSDTDAIQQNIIANLFTISMRDLTDPILGMEGIYNERMLYVTDQNILLSEKLNIDSYDPRYSLKAFGGASEHNLWIKKVSNNILVLATTKDLYEISGTLLDLPDGTIDVNIRPIGEAFPPLSQDVTSTDGAIFYAAADGWRLTTGSNSVHIDASAAAPNKLSLLLQGLPRYGTPDFISNPGNTTRYAVGIGRSKFYAVAQCSDGTRRLLVYDLVKQIWRLQATDPTIIYITKTDLVLLGYGLGSGNFIQQMEYGTDGSVDGLHGQAIFLQTVYDHNQQPRNRKDTFTLKLVVDTGGVSIAVLLGVDGQGFTPLTDIQGSSTPSTSTQQTIFFDLSAYTLGFRYAIQILGVNLTRFKLYEYTIEYDPRPEQKVFHRILDDNFGTNCRKRVVSYPLVIDTLNHHVNLTIYKDGGQIDTDVIQTNGKWTFTHYFLSETIGTFLGATLESSEGPFEFYGFLNDAFISEKLPEPAEFLVVPEQSFGSPSRKRLRTIPIIINTRGQNVQFQPRIDGALQSQTTVLNSGIDRKATLFHYFNSDVFGIDYAGLLSSMTNPPTPFEFYGFDQLVDVEVLPIARVFDQIGPIRTDKIGKLFRFRMRVISFDANIPYQVVSENEVSVPTYANSSDNSGVILASVGADTIYEVMLPKSVNAAVFRIILGPTVNPFHRYDCQVLIADSGMESTSKWQTIR